LPGASRVRSDRFGQAGVGVGGQEGDATQTAILITLPLSRTFTVSASFGQQHLDEALSAPATDAGWPVPRSNAATLEHAAHLGGLRIEDLAIRTSVRYAQSGLKSG
jgi:hypothetical protein